MKIHQILPALNYGDAVSNDVIEIRNALRKMGHKSNIYAKYTHPKVSKFAKQLDTYKPNANNIVIYHFSLANSDVTTFVKSLPDVKVLKYHNITPHQYFDNINSDLFNACMHGRDELKSLSNVIKLALGDSEYNKKELVDNGFNDTGVLPITIDYGKYNISPNKKLMKKYDDGYTNLLFVGRISPNKKQEDLIKIFYYYKKINPKSRLFLVGSQKGMDRYLEELEDIIDRLQLKDVIFSGHIAFNELIAYYNLADVFVSMSEHEGFCVPLLEAMHFNIPIIAYNSTAIPYTLADSGILVNEKRYDEIAELIHLLLNNNELKNKIVEKQTMRLRDFSALETEKKIEKYIRHLTEPTNQDEIS